MVEADASQCLSMLQPRHKVYSILDDTSGTHDLPDNSVVAKSQIRCMSGQVNALHIPQGCCESCTLQYLVSARKLLKERCESIASLQQPHACIKHTKTHARHVPSVVVCAQCEHQFLAA